MMKSRLGLRISYGSIPKIYRRIGTLFCAFTLCSVTLTACAPSGEVAVLEEANSSFSETTFNSSKVKIFEVDSSLSEREQVRVLQEAGYEFSKYSKRVGSFFKYVDGKNGKNVNRVAMSPNLFKDVAMERKAYDDEAIGIFYAGGKLQKISLRKNYEDGEDLSYIESRLSADIGRKVVLSKGQDRQTLTAKILLFVDGSSSQSVLNISAELCASENSNNKGYYESMWSDIGANTSNKGGKVCKFGATFETPQAMISTKGKKGLHEASLYGLREEYIKKFGNPDCWVQDDGCVPEEDIEAIKENLDKKMSEKLIAYQ